MADYLSRAREITKQFDDGDFVIELQDSTDRYAQRQFLDYLRDFKTAETTANARALVNAFDELKGHQCIQPSEPLIKKYNDLVKRYNDRLTDVKTCEEDLKKALKNYERLYGRYSQLREAYEADTGNKLPPLPKGDEEE